MVKQTQKIRRLLSTNCLSVFDHLVGFSLFYFAVVFALIILVVILVVVVALFQTTRFVKRGK